jgi:hypothetical protein
VCESIQRRADEGETGAESRGNSDHTPHLENAKYQNATNANTGSPVGVSIRVDTHGDPNSPLTCRTDAS